MAGITDTFLSDVHIGTFHTLSDQVYIHISKTQTQLRFIIIIPQGTLVTRFSFTLPVPQDGSAAKHEHRTHSVEQNYAVEAVEPRDG